MNQARTDVSLHVPCDRGVDKRNHRLGCAYTLGHSSIWRTLSGRMEGSSQVMKKGWGARSGSWNLDMAATRHVSSRLSGSRRSMWPSMWSSLLLTTAASSSDCTQNVMIFQGCSSVTSTEAMSLRQEAVRGSVTTADGIFQKFVVNVDWDLWLC